MNVTARWTAPPGTSRAPSTPRFAALQDRESCVGCKYTVLWMMHGGCNCGHYRMRANAARTGKKWPPAYSKSQGSDTDTTTSRSTETPSSKAIMAPSYPTTTVELARSCHCHVLAPMEITSPATPTPGIYGGVMVKYSPPQPLLICVSNVRTGATDTSITTSPGPAIGSGSSLTASTSDPSEPRRLYLPACLPLSLSSLVSASRSSPKAPFPCRIVDCRQLPLPETHFSAR